MKYLLIDFGASFVKHALYDSDSKTFGDQSWLTSPFVTHSKVNKEQVRAVLDKIIRLYSGVDRILACSILGGYYVDDIYYSWKCSEKPAIPKSPSCLVGGLFYGEDNFHIHEHQASSLLGCGNGLETVKVLGQINGVPIYSSLGDTNCVAKHFDLKAGELLINMGTGSQVMYNLFGKIHTVCYIPSGRAFAVFRKFFGELGVNIFPLLNSLSASEVQKGSLDLDLRVFSQALGYSSGGSITGINEDSFSIKNLLASMLKSYINQYDEFIDVKTTTKIILTGGIPKKTPVIGEVFELKYPNQIVVLDDAEIERTICGLSKYADDLL